MRSRVKRVRRRDGSVYRINGKREWWKSRRMGVNRTIQTSIDWTQQSVWIRKGEVSGGTQRNQGGKGKAGKDM